MKSPSAGTEKEKRRSTLSPSPSPRGPPPSSPAPTASSSTATPRAIKATKKNVAKSPITSAGSPPIAASTPKSAANATPERKVTQKSPSQEGTKKPKPKENVVVGPIVGEEALGSIVWARIGSHPWYVRSNIVNFQSVMHVLPSGGQLLFLLTQTR